MNPRDWEWKWIFWQVLAPIVGPIVISAGCVLLWWTGQPQLSINWRVIVDVSPWALTFYCITLIGGTMNDLWPKIKNHAILGLSLIAVAFAVTLYASFIVIWRQDLNFIAGTSVYLVTFILLGISIFLCHEGARI